MDRRSYFHFPCAGSDRVRHRDSCQTDSGGPLILKGDAATEDLQIGVSSWGIGALYVRACCMLKLMSRDLKMMGLDLGLGSA